MVKTNWYETDDFTEMHWQLKAMPMRTGVRYTLWLDDGRTREVYYDWDECHKRLIDVEKQYQYK